MAASCISVSMAAVAPLAAARSVEATGAKQSARLAVPSFGAGVRCRLDSAPLARLSLGAEARRVGIVARAADLEEAPAAVAAPASTKLYVGNLPWSIHSKELAEIFQEVGNVELVEVIYDRDTQKSRGFAFVTMSTVEEAQKAIDALEGSELDGRVIRVSFPQPREPRTGDRNNDRRERPAPRERRGDFSPRASDSETKLFVGNLSWGVDDAALDELFREHGTVQEARVVCDRDTGRSRGFGFVKFATQNECNQAIQALDGAEFDGRPLKVNPAGDKPERRDGPRY
ncbi:hypothetical protein MPTK1_3g24820 [Marchantia polymorpha subsp. ruderalis]|uniref:RRM domain-containing protein n=2 Tax=Marchantia polymorpha TaxID=3197 RepID=A0AAF6B4H0_MARPO|nr:hypothetical protein MARPO_0183s0014 [Marchantia polymorpha]BBN06904.1 hypothetical protein Mp_3g24820 [Marchantia polymorpha subsp. ruderalis]|eukprot:PTQ27809.1 hypothetical protein MARPO_0183s0014 [Marchantia polymorpha]